MSQSPQSIRSQSQGQSALNETERQPERAPTPASQQAGNLARVDSQTRRFRALQNKPNVAESSTEKFSVAGSSTVTEQQAQAPENTQGQQPTARRHAFSSSFLHRHRPISSDYATATSTLRTILRGPKQDQHGARNDASSDATSENQPLLSSSPDKGNDLSDVPDSPVSATAIPEFSHERAERGFEPGSPASVITVIRVGSPAESSPPHAANESDDVSDPVAFSEDSQQPSDHQTSSNIDLVDNIIDDVDDDAHSIGNSTLAEVLDPDRVPAFDHGRTPYNSIASSRSTRPSVSTTSQEAAPLSGEDSAAGSAIGPSSDVYPHAGTSLPIESRPPVDIRSPSSVTSGDGVSEEDSAPPAETGNSSHYTSFSLFDRYESQRASPPSPSYDADRSPPQYSESHSHPNRPPNRGGPVVDPALGRPTFGRTRFNRRSRTSELTRSLQRPRLRLGRRNPAPSTFNNYGTTQQRSQQGEQEDAGLSEQEDPGLSEQEEAHGQQQGQEEDSGSGTVIADVEQQASRSAKKRACKCSRGTFRCVLGVVLLLVGIFVSATSPIWYRHPRIPHPHPHPHA
ncbi:hypothetical protein F5Y05DRAFT_423920 [Hypoxylon sp. FL0543]|nr:hypothetical protein F5Y05DRAFT_423920 [Hypoxylon sp. FL0543]